MAELKRLSDHEIEVTAFSAVGVVEANIKFFLRIDYKAQSRAYGVFYSV